MRLSLERARQALEPEERLILKMRFDDAVPVSEIASSPAPESKASVSNH